MAKQRLLLKTVTRSCPRFRKSVSFSMKDGKKTRGGGEREKKKELTDVQRYDIDAPGRVMRYGTEQGDDGIGDGEVTRSVVQG